MAPRKARALLDSYGDEPAKIKEEASNYNAEGQLLPHVREFLPFTDSRAVFCLTRATRVRPAEGRAGKMANNELPKWKPVTEQA